MQNELLSRQPLITNTLDVALESQILSGNNKLETNFEKHKLETASVVETHLSTNGGVNNNVLAEDHMDQKKNARTRQ